MVRGDDDTSVGTVQGLGPPTLGESAEKIAGRYSIVRLLGGGGMGRVYEALDGELGERIALKVLHGLVNQEALERFRREVRLTRKIQHRNVARMFDIGDHGGAKFLTMELVDGASLSHVLGGKALSWHRLRGAALQIAQGLAAAHALGVIHRDLKPDNVLVEASTGRYVITDFGIARGGDDPNVTQLGQVVGTPRYMAPEQLAGGETDLRADVFSLGVMLYEMASASRPWPGDNPIAIAVAQATTPMTPLVPSPTLPADFVAVVHACLAIDPGARPANASELVTLLEQTIAAVLPGAARAAVSTPSSGVAIRATASFAMPTAAHVAPTVNTSLAVMPVQCGPGDEYLADGMLDDLVDTLSTIAGLRVRPAGLSRGTAQEDVLEVGRRLEVEQVVTVSLRRTEAGLRVGARLISVTDGFQIWAHRAELTESEVFVQSEALARGIAGALSSRAIAVTKPTDPRAVELYLRARAELRQFWGKHAVAATALLDDAVRIAPDSAQISGALAYASVQAWVMTTEPTLIEPAKRALERGLALGHGEAFLASAIFKFNTANALGGAADLHEALVRAPMSAPVHEYTGRLFLEFGPIDRARHHLSTTMGLDPGRTLLIMTELARLDALLGDVASARKKLDLLDGNPDASLTQVAQVFRGRIDEWYGTRDPQQRTLKRLATRLGGHAERLAQIIQVAAEGKPVDATAWNETIHMWVHEVRPMRLVTLVLQLLAETAAAHGADEQAFSALDQSCDSGLVDLMWMDHCPLLARLQGDPRWADVRSRVAGQGTQIRALLGEPPPSQT